MFLRVKDSQKSVRKSALCTFSQHVNKYANKIFTCHNCYYCLIIANLSFWKKDKLIIDSIRISMLLEFY